MNTINLTRYPNLAQSLITQLDELAKEWDVSCFVQEINSPFIINVLYKKHDTALLNTGEIYDIKQDVKLGELTINFRRDFSSAEVIENLAVQYINFLQELR